MMAARKRGIKRKSADFIYEVDDKDLSTDEDDNVRNPSCKIIKGESIETTETKHNLSANTEKSESPEFDGSNDLVPMNTNEIDSIQSDVEKNRLINEKSDKKGTQMLNDSDVIEIDDSVDQNKSVVIIEEPISIMVLSDDDDDVGEEGEILEDLKIVDEVSATPYKETLLTEPLEKEIPEQILSDIDEEFQVVEEIGPSPIPNEKKNLMNITFSCQKSMNDYGHLLVKFLKSFPEIETVTEKLCIRVNEKEIFPDTRTPKKKNKRKKPKKDLFVVDTNPSSKDDNIYSSLVRYSSKFTIEEEGQPEKVPTNSRSAQICFNCGGEHALRDCGAPRNHQRINQARQQFLDRNKTVRYHGEQSQKLAEFKPGVISENLRNALGLQKNQVPNHIYRMRKLGYPPGWLEEAKVSPSDLTMFDIDGEKLEHNKRKKTTIDPDKIIEYPGFNMPLKKGCYDDFRRHNVKPYNKSMHKSSMIKHFQELYKNEILVDSGSDIDISNIKEAETKTKSIEKMVKDRAAASSSSPSLVDLEEKKKELIDQLNANQDQKLSINDSEDNPPEAKIQEDSLKIQDISMKEDNVTAVKNSSLGTPILKSSSPYARLPNPDNFSVGVSPVIDFENLPNSTGKYEELSKVLNKVRMTMKHKF